MFEAVSVQSNRFRAQVEQTWIRERLNSNKGWTGSEEDETVSSTAKIMATIIWDAKRVLLVEYLEKWKIINNEHYANLLEELHQKIREKRPGVAKNKKIGDCSLRWIELINWALSSTSGTLHTWLGSVRL